MSQLIHKFSQEKHKRMENLTINLPHLWKEEAKEQYPEAKVHSPHKAKLEGKNRGGAGDETKTDTL